MNLFQLAIRAHAESALSWKIKGERARSDLGKRALKAPFASFTVQLVAGQRLCRRTDKLAGWLAQRQPSSCLNILWPKSSLYVSSVIQYSRRRHSPSPRRRRWPPLFSVTSQLERARLWCSCTRHSSSTTHRHTASPAAAAATK